MESQIRCHYRKLHTGMVLQSSSSRYALGLSEAGDGMEGCIEI